MGGLIYDISLSDVAAEAYLKKLGTASLDADLMEDIAGIYESSTLERFETNIAPDGTPWVQSQRVQQAQGNAKTLLETGTHLRDTITTDSGQDFAQVGTNSPIAAIHQAGGKAGRNRSVKIPARPYIGSSAADKIDVEDAVLAYLDYIQ